MRRDVTVLVGERDGLLFALGPIHPEEDRARRDGEVLARRFHLEGAGFARLVVARFGKGSASFDADLALVRGRTRRGDEVVLRPLGAFPLPSDPRDALLFRSLAGPAGKAALEGSATAGFLFVVPGARRPADFAEAELGEARLARATVEEKAWRNFLAAPDANLFASVASAPASR